MHELSGDDENILYLGLGVGIHLLKLIKLCS